MDHDYFAHVRDQAKLGGAGEANGVASAATADAGSLSNPASHSSLGTPQVN